MNQKLPPLDVARVSPTAYGVAERLFEAFFQQDLRETFLRGGDPEGARDAAAEATTAMAEVFCAEFPDRPRTDARRAGETFARALFLQDEIENWDAIRAVAGRLPPAAVVSDLSTPSANGVLADARWEEVCDLLERVCSDVGIADAYCRRQTEFWRAHGERTTGWRQTAFEAHRLKIEAMVAGCPDADADALARYFVVGVERHDQWCHTDRDRDFAEMRELVATYYQRVFELRGDVLIR